MRRRMLMSSEHLGPQPMVANDPLANAICKYGLPDHTRRVVIDLEIDNIAKVYYEVVDGGKIQGLLDDLPGLKGVVVNHPGPLIIEQTIPMSAIQKKDFAASWKKAGGGQVAILLPYGTKVANTGEPNRPPPFFMTEELCKEQEPLDDTGEPTNAQPRPTAETVSDKTAGGQQGRAPD